MKAYVIAVALVSAAPLITAICPDGAVGLGVMQVTLRGQILERLLSAKRHLQTCFIDHASGTGSKSTSVTISLATLLITSSVL